MPPIRHATSHPAYSCSCLAEVTFVVIGVILPDQSPLFEIADTHRLHTLGLSLWAQKAGNSRAASIAIMAMTTNNSISVNALLPRKSLSSFS
ncbi:MAG: hypothetical protein Ct9H300mP7_6160 [Verrucomicrobiota bacterium]|nr:MAG: hypothetical protein Ct9H300mP7_6160 [Verrucomicrobiota bacterium]